MGCRIDRRSFLNRSLAAGAVAMGLHGFEEKALLEHQAIAAQNDPTKKKKEEPINGMANGKIGNIEISRVIIGSNLFGGGAHARNLKYVSELMARYFTDEKIMDTLQLCEENGINTNIGAPELVNMYNKERGGRMKCMAQLEPGRHNWNDDKNTDGTISITKKDIQETVESAAEQGCVGAHLQGGRGDRWVRMKRLDMIQEFVSCVRKNGMLAGIGGHDKRVPFECEKAGIDCDYYFKTIHPDSYWGAIPEEQKKPFLVDSFAPGDHDCMWEQWPHETIEVMKNIKKPWIGYKVLAAGAIHPTEGFKFAFENGVDFVCVGMFDWQVRDNVETAIEILAAEKTKNRTRKWA
jgi:hypothetical protein